jgi:N-acetylmuramoyl-L-alanine amidase
MGIIDRPVNNAEVIGITRVSGYILDRDGIAKVEILVDGVVMGEASSITAAVVPAGKMAANLTKYVNKDATICQGMFSYSLDTERLRNGWRKISIREWSSAGYTDLGFARINVQGSKVPGEDANIDAPIEGNSIRGPIYCSGWAFSEFGVRKVEIVVNDETIGEATITRNKVIDGYPEYGVASVGFTYTIDTSGLVFGATNRVSAKIGVIVTANNGSKYRHTEESVVKNIIVVK